MDVKQLQGQLMVNSGDDRYRQDASENSEEMW